MARQTLAPAGQSPNAASRAASSASAALSGRSTSIGGAVAVEELRAKIRGAISHDFVDGRKALRLG